MVCRLICRRWQEEDANLASFAGLRELPAKSPANHGVFDKKWDADLGMERIYVHAGASVAEVEALGLEVLKDELVKLGMKCGGTVQQRAERLWRVRGVTGQALTELLEQPQNQDLIAGKTKEKRRNQDVSVQLVLDREKEREQKRARKTQGPLLPGLERRVGQKSLPKPEVGKSVREGHKRPERDEFDKL